ncbi:hypothetical protein MMH89_04470 [Candidatus Comchoanobacter bicostacola]|uniref:Uncharacterized protein n=1 Tax=Candidatus Comchoanobacter bicostacola TaxID=2919598 RepID=A0ABY5DKZ1_9GAMM|nr:hypothetical protein [Candidatus Comchoanobacter bicostacola]UTC24472.1 hypothetical protein MMH89_04470 [Candidatus Comchoanobacter bicostacola]
MTKQNQTLGLILASFLVPILIASILAYTQYTGETANLGTWIEEKQSLNTLLTPLPEANNYQWYVVYNCQECPYDQSIKNALVTLNTKQDLVCYIGKEAIETMSLSQQDIDDQTLLLADPHKQLILSYPAEQPLDLIKDLKKILKSVSK